MERIGRARAGAAALALVAVLAGCSSDRPAAHTDPPSTATPSSTVAPTPTTSAPAPTSPPPTRTSTPTHSRPAPSTSHRSATPSTSRRPSDGSAHLPLSFPTGSAQQAVTVVASSTSSTQATLQTWQKRSGRWQRVGPGVPAWLGSDGLSQHPSESRSATPIGSFTLTRAFGHDADPGTALPYTRTTPDDWWISQSGPRYNTLQHCASSCPFTRGDPNEHLYYETPYYDYAVVIDYNTANAPGGVRQGAGSAFFLHVHPPGTGATAGCVSIAEDQLVRILRWLRPAAHPRILIGAS